MKKYNEIGADKVRKSRASYENIYHSTNVWLQRALELICVFLRRGCLALQDGEFSTARDFFWAAALIHNLLEPVIGTMKAEEGERERERWGEREREREGPGPAVHGEKGVQKMGPNVIKRRTAVLNQTRPSTHTFGMWSEHHSRHPPPTQPLLHLHLHQDPWMLFVWG